jgi:hypothetical protein
MRMLTTAEADQFREDFRQKEQEIQKNIGIYLSALVVAVGWVVGPQAKPLDELFLGNDGRNLYGLLVVVAVNVIFAVFLAYKGLIIHEYTQFVAYLMPTESAFQYWESWRRSKQSATKRWGTRTLYTAVISIVPLSGAILLMILTFQYMNLGAPDIAEFIVKTTPAMQTSQPGGTAAAAQVIGKPSLTPGQRERQAHLQNTIASVKWMWAGVACFHIVPLWVFIVSVVPTNRLWREIQASKPGIPRFDALEYLPDEMEGRSREEGHRG